MKLSTLTLAATLALGGATAWAQEHGESGGTTAARDAHHPRAAQRHDGPTAGQKMRNAMHRMGDKVRHAMHRTGDSAHRTASRERDRNDTSAMGASGTDDHGRRARMDEAYSHWRARQEKSS